MILIWILAGIAASYIYWNETKHSIYPIKEDGPWLATVMIVACLALGLVSLCAVAAYAIVRRIG